MMSLNGKIKFHAVFLISFAIVFVSALIFLNKKFDRPSLDHKLSEAIPSDWIDHDVVSAKNSKRHERFWASTYAASFGDGSALLRGVALKTNERDELFQSAFPGYPNEMRLDKNLWKNYFTKKFDQSSWSYLLHEKHGVDVLMQKSYSGCFDIFKNYGADVIILGNSEVYQGIIPDRFSRMATPPGEKPLRVLNCGVAAMSLRTMKETALELSKIKKEKIPLIVWGLSFWSTINPNQSLDDSLQGIQNESSQPSLIKNIRSVWGISLADFFDFRGWDDFFYARFDRSNRFIAGFSSSVPIPASIQSDSEKIEREIEKIIPSFGILSSARDSDCKLETAEKLVRETVSNLTQVAERVYIYIPPTTRKHVAGGPPCLFPRVKEMMSAVRSGQVHTSFSDWSAYGLNYSDYVYPTENREVVKIDFNHVGYSGAEKVTAHIAKNVRKSLYDL